MSWQGYIDDTLLKTGNIDQAAIFSAAGDSVWAASPGFSVKPDEVQAIVKGFADPGNLYSNGCFIGGVKYMIIKADDRSIYAKKDKHGFCCVKTKQAMILAHYPETIQPGAAATTVEKLGDYLIGVGY